MARPRWTAQQDDELRALRAEGMTFRDCADVMGKAAQSIHARWQILGRDGPTVDCAEAMAAADRLSVPGEGQSIVGVIGDTHLPFAHRDYMGFCLDTFEKWGCTQYVHIGDLVENHAISFHPPDPEGLSPGDEWNAMTDELAVWIRHFPKLTWIIGNHDALPKRKVFASGLPAHFIRKNLYGIPEGWRQAESADIDGVLYTHGIGAGGEHGHKKLAMKRRTNCVIGHFHRNAGVHYTPTHDGEMGWGMAVGCGIDHDSYSQAYSKAWGRMALGCGIVRYGVEAHFIPMLNG